MLSVQHTTDAISIAYDTAGSGLLVVFLHGIGGNRTNWTGLNSFSNRFCAVFWDWRGHGDSNDSPQRPKFSDYADDVLRLLDRLKPDKAHLVGLSMGRMIIQDFYGRYADRVATLSLVDTSPGFGGISEEVKHDFLSRRLDPLGRGLTPPDVAPGAVEIFVAKSASVPVREKLKASLSAVRVEPYKQALRAIVTTDFRPVLPNITAPTLIIFGEEDQVTPSEASDFLVSNIAGSSLVKIPSAGHLTNIERPEAFNAALGAFLDHHARQASMVSARRRETEKSTDMPAVTDTAIS